MTRCRHCNHRVSNGNSHRKGACPPKQKIGGKGSRKTAYAAKNGHGGNGNGGSSATPTLERKDDFAPAAAYVAAHPQQPRSDPFPRYMAGSGGFRR